MKIMIMPSSLELMKKAINKFDSVMLGIKDLSVNMPVYYTFEEFLKIYNYLKENGKEVFVALNKNMHNKDIAFLKEIMFKLENLDIKGIIYYDIALVNIKEEYNLKTPLVWGQEHLTTNYITSNYWNKFGASYTLVSNEITKEEILEMKEHSLSKLIVTVFGYLPMFVSERHLVKNYLKTFDLKDDSKVNYIEKEGNIYPIIDSDYGTFAFSSHILNGIKEALQFKDKGIDYILLNSFLIDDDKFIMVLDLFNNMDNSNILDSFRLIEDTFNTDNGFLNKETIYKVKKNG